MFSWFNKPLLWYLCSVYKVLLFQHKELTPRIRQLTTCINVPTTLINAFLRVSIFVSTKTKQTIFDHTGVFIFLFCFFSHVHIDSFSFKNAYFLMRFYLLFRLKWPKTLIETTIYDAFFGTVFKSLRFHLSKLEKERFQNYAFLKGATFETVFKSLRFHQTFRVFFVGICLLK